jgi:23S rRNA (uracil1939-C5)-methyltransferase
VTASSQATLSSDPACNPACGACHYKALDYPAQLRRKQAWAEGQLGRWKEALQPILPAPPEDRIAYRSKSWMRSRFEAGALSFGMFRGAQGDDGKWGKEFVSWDTCPLHIDAIQAMVPRLAQALAQVDGGRFAERSLWGIWLGAPHLVVVARGEELAEMRGVEWHRILSPPFDRVWWHRTHQVGKTVFQHREFHPVYGKTLGPGSPGSGPPIRAFRQVARTLLTQARQRAVAALLGKGPEAVVDLYCGTGELATLLPSEVGWLGVELSVEAVSYAREQAPAGRGVHAAFAGPVEQRLRDPRLRAAIPDRYALYLNPPRTGLGEEARQELIELIRDKPPRSIVYLSCSASSLKRDLEALEGSGFRVKDLQPYDFFPQTEHFETLAVCVPK